MNILGSGKDSVVYMYTNDKVYIETKDRKKIIFLKELESFYKKDFFSLEIINEKSFYMNKFNEYFLSEDLFDQIEYIIYEYIYKNNLKKDIVYHLKDFLFEYGEKIKKLSESVFFSFKALSKIDLSDGNFSLDFHPGQFLIRDNVIICNDILIEDLNKKVA
jgi:hypothetical protein